MHGVGQGIIKDEVYKVLKQNKLVEDFHLNHFNQGCTIVYIKRK